MGWLEILPPEIESTIQESLTRMSKTGPLEYSTRHSAVSVLESSKALPAETTRVLGFASSLPQDDDELHHHKVTGTRLFQGDQPED